MFVRKENNAREQQTNNLITDKRIWNDLENGANIAGCASEFDFDK